MQQYIPTEQSINVRSLFQSDDYCAIDHKTWRIASAMIINVQRSNRFSSRGLVLGLRIWNDFAIVNIDKAVDGAYVSACFYLGFVMDDLGFLNHHDWEKLTNTSEESLLSAIRQIVLDLDAKLYPPTPYDTAHEIINERAIRDSSGVVRSIVILTCALDPKYFAIDPYILTKGVIYLYEMLERDELPTADDSPLQVSIYNDITSMFRSGTQYDGTLGKKFIELRPLFHEGILPQGEERTQHTIRDHNGELERRAESEEIYPLGSGTYGSVTLALRNMDVVAIKHQNIADNIQALSELYILSNYKHANVLSMSHFYLYNGSLDIDLEPGESLLKLVYGDDKQRGADKWYQTYIRGEVGERVLKRREKYMRDICDGLEYLHSVGIIHRDLKLDNIIIVGDTAKIADFGLSYVMCLSYNNEQHKSIDVITEMYCPPELLLARHGIIGKSRISRYAFEVDVWSLGCVLLELETEVLPFHYDLRHMLSDRMQKTYSLMFSVFWCMARILGRPSESLYPDFPYEFEGTGLEVVASARRRTTIASMLDYRPKSRARMSEVRV